MRKEGRKQRRQERCMTKKLADLSSKQVLRPEIDRRQGFVAASQGIRLRILSWSSTREKIRWVVSLLTTPGPASLMEDPSVIPVPALLTKEPSIIPVLYVAPLPSAPPAPEPNPPDSVAERPDII